MDRERKLIKTLTRFTDSLDAYKQASTLISQINTPDELSLLACAFFNIANLESSIQKYSDYKKTYMYCIHYGIKSKHSLLVLVLIY